MLLPRELYEEWVETHPRFIERFAPCNLRGLEQYWINNFENFIEFPGEHVYLQPLEGAVWIETTITGQVLTEDGECVIEDGKYFDIKLTIVRACHHCEEQSKVLMKCGLCTTRYCGRTCQKNAWKQRKCGCQN